MKKMKRREAGLHPGLWTLILLSTIAALVALTVGAFDEGLEAYARVTLASDRGGLVMEPVQK